MGAHRRHPAYRLSRWMLVAASRFVPSAHRAEWRREWYAELEHRAERIAGGDSRIVHGWPGLVRRVAGAGVDAVHLRRAEWRGELMFQDLRYAFRALRRAPMYTLVTVITLGLGIGANTAIFSAVNGILLQPLPFPDSDGLVMVWEANVERGWPRFTVSPANYLDWRDDAEGFAGLAAFTTGTETVTGRGDPESLRVAYVSAELFDLLGVPAAIGRTLRSDENEVGRAQVVVLSQGVWERLFGADSTVLGTTVRLDGNAAEIVGVMPGEFTFPTVDVWRPLTFDFDASQARGAHYLTVLGRLEPGVSVVQAQASMDALAAALEAAYPGTNSGWTAPVVPLREQILGPTIRQTLFVIWGAVGLVLLIACTNVANLILSRSMSRRQELAVRAALGAGRARLVRQFLAESAWLCGGGAAMGVALAVGGVRLLRALEPGDIPRVETVSIDGITLGFTAGVTLLTALVFAIVPVRHGLATERSEALSSARWQTTGRGSRRIRQALVVAEVALALVVAVGSGLLTRSFQRLTAVDPGFDGTDLLALNVAPPARRYPDIASVTALYREAFDHIAQMPGVMAVGGAAPLPLSGDFRFSYQIVGDEPMPETSGLFRRVAGDYFRTMGIPLIRGRLFTWADGPDSPPVVIINESFARLHFGGRDPIGHSLEIGSRDVQCPCEIVGVVGDVRQYGPTAGPVHGYYLPASQLTGFRGLSIAVKTAGDVPGIVSAVRAVFARLDPALALDDFGPFDDRIADSVARPRFNAILLGGFAAISLVLATVGIYGVIAHGVAQRSREIGIRIALGAGGKSVARMIVRQAAGLTGLGVLIGLAGALFATRFIVELLFETSPLDPLTLLAASGLFVGVGLVAAYVPARRAAAVDPIEALRVE